MNKVLVTLAALTAAYAIVGCALMMGTYDSYGRTATHSQADRAKADAELTCAEINRDLADVDADLQAARTKLVYVADSKTARSGSSGTAPQNQIDAYQRRHDELTALRKAKTCP
jgi:hypothetical protein